MNGSAVPVVAIDGPTASGKGTVAAEVARALHFHYLDSGALYRLVAHAALKSAIPLDDAERIAAVARKLEADFRDGEITMDGERVTDAIRSEACGNAASVVAALPALRDALIERQRAFRRGPGLVADGRDMGSVVFPDAALKVFLTGSVEARADRRYKQLIEKGLDANISAILQDIGERDARDCARNVSPLQVARDALIIDSTGLSIAQVVAQVLDFWQDRPKR
jgi:cytidylate kinase